MRADDEQYADGPSAAAVLAVADGLRRRDPQVSAALAEHAARLAHDGGPRGEAELSAVLARRELDRPDEVVGRGMPSLLAAEDEGRTRDAAVLRCALVDAALALGDLAVAEALLAPAVTARGLPEHVRLAVVVGRAHLAAALGDVAAADALAAEAQALSATREEQLLARTDVDLARARARRNAGEHAAARGILRALVDEPVPESVDAGRRHLLATAQLVETELDLDDPAAARAAGEPVLDRLGDVTTALPLARVRCLLAARVHLPSGEHTQAAALARAAVDGLTGRGHDRDVAAAEEILADVAEARDDLRTALATRRRAHHLEREALLAEGAVRVALAAGLRTGVPAPAVVAVVEEELPVASRAIAGRARAGTSVASGEADRLGGDPGDPGDPAGPDDSAVTTWPAPRPDRPAGTSGRRRARTGAEEPDRADADAASAPPDGLDARSALRGAAPHGLSRILEEITADARTSSTADRDLGASGHSANGQAVNGHAIAAHGTNGHVRPADGSEDAAAAEGVRDGDDEYARELRLTLVDLLAEYGDDGPSTAGAPARRASAPAPASAERAAPLTAWSFHDASASGSTAAPGAARNGNGTASNGTASNGTAGDGTASEAPGAAAEPGPDSGARLADLLAEAMDAFRRSAPGDGTIGAGPPPDQRAHPDHRTDHRTDRWGVRR